MSSPESAPNLEVLDGGLDGSNEHPPADNEEPKDKPELVDVDDKLGKEWPDNITEQDIFKMLRNNIGLLATEYSYDHGNMPEDIEVSDASLNQVLSEVGIKDVSEFNKNLAWAITSSGKTTETAGQNEILAAVRYAKKKES